MPSPKQRKARRPRPNALAGQLSKAQNQQLRAWLVTEKLSYMEASQRLFDWWGISTTQQTISRYWMEHCRCIEQRRAALKHFSEIELPQFSIDIQLTFRQGDKSIGTAVVNLPVDGGPATLSPGATVPAPKPPRRNSPVLTKQ